MSPFEQQIALLLKICSGEVNTDTHFLDESVQDLAAVVNLHQGEYTKAQVVDRGKFAWIFKRILTPLERQVLSYKVDGYTNLEISALLGCNAGSVKRTLVSILCKYRNGLKLRPEKFNPRKYRRKA